MASPLISNLSLIEGETPSGYASRLARLHGRTPRDFCSDLGLHWPNLCSGHLDQLERLAWLTGHDFQALKLWSAVQLSLGRYRTGKAISSSRMFRRTACRCCPRCVWDARENGGAQMIFELLEWKVLSLHRCEKHGIQFITLPPAEFSHEAYDFTTQVLRHWAHIENAMMTASVLPATQFEDYVRGRVRSGAKDDWLAKLNLANLHASCLNLGAALNGIKTQKMRNLKEVEMHRLLEVGFSNLLKGELGLSDALIRLRENSRSERPYYSSDLGPFYHWLKEVFEDKSLLTMVEVTREHIFQCYPVPLDREVFGQKPKREIWLSMDEARKRSGFGAVFLKKVLGHIEGHDRSEALRRTDVKVDELAKVQAFWRKHMNLSEVSEALSLRFGQVKGLMDFGILGAIKITSTLRYVPRDEVTALLNAVAELPQELAGKSVVPLKDFCRDKHVPLPQVIKLWVDGELDGKLCRGRGEGLHAIEVDWNVMFDRQKATLNSDLMLPEAATYLKIGIGSIRHLRDAGYLSEVRRRNPDTNHLKSYITRSSIRRFEQTYITLGQMACERKVAPMHLARKFDHEGLPSITCQSSMVRVYKRDVIVQEGA